MSIFLTSVAIDALAPIPHRHARDGDDLSPPLRWDGVPESAAELVVICEDPDAPTDKPFVHWLRYGIPPDAEGLMEASDVGIDGKTDWGEPGYGGPQPPRGDGPHHYHFRVFAVDSPLDLEPGADRDTVEKAMRGHVIGEGELVATFER